MIIMFSHGVLGEEWSHQGERQAKSSSVPEYCWGHNTKERERAVDMSVVNTPD